MGQGTSRPDKEFFQELPENERYFGFENFGNTCYCNSVLQALYFSPPFRQRVLEYAAQLSSRSDAKESILTCLAELFAQVRLIMCVVRVYSSRDHQEISYLSMTF